ncbi:glycoside hydrolase family 97 protein [Halalkalibaculum sp. DA384]|uniref:glycoside hydrolase family 97 protein n=1 Tax=Halalkalibaculum sp. DA384 TaxID=3373606 RepID=UPI003754B836
MQREVQIFGHILLIIVLFGICTEPLAAQPQQQYQLRSPNQHIGINIEVHDELTYALTYKGKSVITPSAISLTLEGEAPLGVNPEVVDTKMITKNSQVESPFYKKAQVDDHFEELSLKFKRGYEVIFRAYNDGFAYRFVTERKDSLTIVDERGDIHFAHNYNSYYLKSNSTTTSYEGIYHQDRIDQFNPSPYYLLPIVLEGEEQLKMAVLEADLYDYPGGFLKKHPNDSTRFYWEFPNVPQYVRTSGYRNYSRVPVSSRNFITQTEGNKEFPWRVFILTESETSLLNNDMVYKLSRGPDTGRDFSWVKPGTILFEWWHVAKLYGVDFESGINTQTYKYYIDFAAEHGIPYVNIDEGWSDYYDILKTGEDLDMAQLTSYARQKGVGLFLWAAYSTIDPVMEQAFDLFEQWGIAGVKIDFMNRQDQPMIRFYERAARQAAERKLMVNFHGATKPTGLPKRYPNVVNYEAVRGLEYNKIDDSGIGATPEYAVTAPFIRMLAGAMDYHPGAVRNATDENFRVIFNNPMSRGTRTHQMAMYIIFEMPLAMLSDSPTRYKEEEDMLDFLSSVPTTWDETIALEGSIGEYAVITRRKSDVWYVGGLTNGKRSNAEVNLSFLPSGRYQAEIYKDGPNAHQRAVDYQRLQREVTAQSTISVPMAKGGGFVIVLEPIN